MADLALRGDDIDDPALGLRTLGATAGERGELLGDFLLRLFGGFVA
ncbi:hypothetical protein [Sphingomonas sp. UYP23]